LSLTGVLHPGDEMTSEGIVCSGMAIRQRCSNVRRYISVDAPSCS